MGIPKFFRWISERYPMCSQLVAENEIPSFDFLYLDINGIIHNCCRSLPVGSSRAAHFDQIFWYIDLLLQHIKPTTQFFLAVDGVAPRAKMNQQRARRFRSALEAASQEAKSFDGSQITPGTLFMMEFSIALRKFVEERCNIDSVWSSIEVIVSGPDVPGEGEHKIQEHIRTKVPLRQGFSHCLYGLDADLFMLALITHEPNFCLLREEVVFQRAKSAPTPISKKTPFFLMHISLIRQYLELDFADALGVSRPLPMLERIIDDFVLFSALIGNDFLPTLSMLHIKDNCYELLMKCYSETFAASNGGFLHHQGKINWKVLAVFFHTLSLQEAKSVLGKDDSTGSALDLLSDGQYMEWKHAWYEEKVGSSSVETIHAMCKAYLEGLQWNMTYYCAGVPSWSWYFPFHYAPKILDLYLFISNASHGDLPDSFPMTLGVPFKPLEQLMAVLPKGSSYLVPSALSSLMTDELSPLAVFYPSTFEVDQNGKKETWEAIVLIPFVDESVLRQAISSRLPLLSKEDARRNSVGSDFKCQQGEGALKMLPRSKSVASAFPLSPNSEPRSDFPSLHRVSIQKGFLSDSPILVSSTGKSKLPSLQLRILESRISCRDSSLAALVNSLVYVNWPFLKCARVVAAHTEVSTFHTDGCVSEAMSYKRWSQLVESLQQRYLSKWAVEVEAIECIVDAILQTEAEEHVSFPLQLVVPYSLSLERTPVKKIENFLAGELAVCIGREIPLAFGSIVEILDEKTASVHGKVFLAAEKHAEISQLVHDFSYQNSKYLPMSKVATMLNVCIPFLLLLTASMPVRINEEKRPIAYLGFKFRKDRDELCAAGYIRKARNGNTWMLSNSAISCLKDLKIAFPLFWIYFNSLLMEGNRDVRDAKVLFSYVKDNYTKECNAVCNWFAAYSFEEPLRMVPVSGGLRLLQSEMHQLVALIRKQFVVEDKPSEKIAEISKEDLIQSLLTNRFSNVQSYSVGDYCRLLSKTLKFPCGFVLSVLDEDTCEMLLVNSNHKIITVKQASRNILNLTSIQYPQVSYKVEDSLAEMKISDPVQKDLGTSVETITSFAMNNSFVTPDLLLSSYKANSTNKK